MISKIIKDKRIIAALVAVLLLIVIVILIAISKNKINIDKDINNNPTITSEEAASVEILSSIINDIDTSDIEMISNINNDQSEIILDSIGINIKDIQIYACSIDPRIESAHSIIIIKPKEDCIENTKNSIMQYILDKQRYFMESGLTDTDMYSIVKNTVTIEESGYIISVMEKDSNEILSIIRDKLKEV